MIAPDAGDGELERGNIDKHVAAVLAQLAIFVVKELAIIVARILSGREHIHNFSRPTGTTGFSTTPLISAKMAELTPMASASVNTATVVNPAVFRSCRKANLKSCIIMIVLRFH